MINVQHATPTFIPRDCPKCGSKMFPLKSIPAQDRCANEKCRWIVTDGRLAKRGRGRPFAKGNTARGAGSGRAKVFTDPVSLTIKVERTDRDFWQREAAACNISLGEYIRDLVNNDY